MDRGTRRFCFVAIGLVASFLVACGSTKRPYAPVSDVATIEHVPRSGVYQVLPGETLYSIAWRYGLDYRYLLRRNHIQPPYHVQSGQLLYLTGRLPEPPILLRQNRMALARTPAPASVLPPPAAERSFPATEPTWKRSPKIFDESASDSDSMQWRWPARGQVIGGYTALNKGINIAGQQGDPIYATASGKVVYSGDGLRNYGKLIIIKHHGVFLTAYAHSKKILVKEGDWVKTGQKIAEMGNTGSRRVMLHFEIRRAGESVNPLLYLTRG